MFYRFLTDPFPEIDFNTTTTPTSVTVIIPDPNTTIPVDVVLVVTPTENMTEPVEEQVSDVDCSVERYLEFPMICVGINTF